MHASVINPALHTVLTNTDCNTLLLRQKPEEQDNCESALLTVPPGLPISHLVSMQHIVVLL